jgi:hypothetical protein
LKKYRQTESVDHAKDWTKDAQKTTETIEYESAYEKIRQKYLNMQSDTRIRSSSPNILVEDLGATLKSEKS